MSTLTLADGRQIDLKTKKVKVDEVEEASHESEALPAIVPKPQDGIKLEDLPTNPKQMNVVNAIIGYRLLGISDSDIVYALGCTDAQLFQIVQSEAFTKCWQMCIDAFVEGQKKTASDLIANNAIHAAKTLVEVAKNSRNEQNKLKASESILNRIGINESNANSAMAQGLVIKVVRDTQSSNVEIKIGV